MLNQIDINQTKKAPTSVHIQNNIDLSKKDFREFAKLVEKEANFYQQMGLEHINKMLA